MKQKQSKKHHYLPRYYLNGFTNSEGSFYVYDKSSDIIRSTNPGDAFFENHLNTVAFPDGITSDFLEGLYARVESEFWPTLDRIRSSTHNTSINPMDKMNLYLFLQFLHWRLPSNIKFAEKLSEEFFRGENGFDYVKLTDDTGEIPHIEVIENLKNSAAFKKSAKMITPLAPFFKDKNWSRNLADWRFIYPGDGKIWFMVGDNPIITGGYSDHDPINCLKEFIFPVSGNILLVTSNIHESEILPPAFILQCNVAIIQRAQRFVACQRKDFLEAVIGLYKLAVKYEKTDSIIIELFEMLKNTSR